VIPIGAENRHLDVPTKGMEDTIKKEARATKKQGRISDRRDARLGARSGRSHARPCVEGRSLACGEKNGERKKGKWVCVWIV